MDLAPSLLAVAAAGDGGAAAGYNSAEHCIDGVDFIRPLLLDVGNETAVPWWDPDRVAVCEVELDRAVIHRDLTYIERTDPEYRTLPYNDSTPLSHTDKHQLYAANDYEQEHNLLAGGVAPALKRLGVDAAAATARLRGALGAHSARTRLGVAPGGRCGRLSVSVETG